MGTVIFWTVIFIVGVGTTIWRLWSLKKTKSIMKSIAFDNQDDFLEAQSVLSKANIPYDHLINSPSQELYNQVGVAQHTPKVLWVAPMHFGDAKKLIETKYLVSTSSNGIRILSKSSLK